ncbi:hypothetical protein KJ918_06730 [Patescibacteria group bacterium]|nr:hypothetical protein [Patescibacteria group bacterium]
MHKIIIEGPNKLNGSVRLQGAKNSAMKHIVFTLLKNGKYLLSNIPDISSAQNLIRIVELQGGKVIRDKSGILSIDTRNVTKPHRINSDLFFHTSGAVHLIPILASRSGTCEIEKHATRKDYGGDKIGARSLDSVINTLAECGISCEEKAEAYEFKIVSDRPFSYNVPVNSFAATVNVVLAALFKNGKSRIRNITREPEFSDVLDFLIEMNSKIKQEDNDLIIDGNSELREISYTIIPDRNDFATWVSAALTTKSEIMIENVNYEKMRLEQMDKVKDEMGFDLEYSGSSCLVKPNTHKLKPLTIEGGRYPAFQTEWQVLFSPVVTQINGTSRIIELLYPNRMKHWEELSKLGAKFRYIQSEKTPEFAIHKTAIDTKTENAVEVSGPQKVSQPWDFA